MTNKKIAVDQATKDYWSTYFGDYGDAWVRDIPMRIVAAVQDKRVVAAALSNPAACAVVPFGAVKTDAGFELEGALVVGDSRRLFHASLDSSGNVIDVTCYQAIKA